VMGRDIEAQDLTAFFPNQATVLDLLLLLVTVGVLAPFTEELLFRGAVYHAYKDSKLGVLGAMLVASFTFALLHADMERFIVFFIGGMVFNVLSRHYNSLAVSMLSHATWNTLSLLAFYSAVVMGGVE
jgi:abortive infection protein